MTFAIRGQPARESLAGESAAQELKKSLQADQYNIRYGPLRFQTEASVGFGYNDNVFWRQNDRRSDFIINPEVTVRTLWPVTERNALRLSLGVGYEWYARNKELNSDSPLINPDSELSFTIFAGDFRIKLRDQFSYQQTLFYNSAPIGNERFFNFNDVGVFKRLDNLAGFTVDWDLNKLILSLGYDHENFIPYTGRFDYLKRSSDYLTASANFLVGDKVKIGPEAQGSLHDYASEAVLSDHWHARVGPFVEMTLLEGVTLRAGGGYERADFDNTTSNSDFSTYYAYGRIRQQTRLFAHALSAGREHLLGDNANNLRTTYVRYTINSPIVKNVDLGAVASVNFAEEFGGPFEEKFDYYRFGARVGWQFHKYIRADAAYDFTQKDSRLPLRDFDQNRVTLALTATF